MVARLTDDSQRPQANAPVFNFTVSEPEQWDQGYIFIGPYQHVAAGPYIYDKFGNLVWDGFGAIGPTNAHDFRPCQYKVSGQGRAFVDMCLFECAGEPLTDASQGEPHLCVTTVNQQLGYGVGNACESGRCNLYMRQTDADIAASDPGLQLPHNCVGTDRRPCLERRHARVPAHQ